MKDQYDYIIVGAGSAGCALANRLSADPAYSVLLVESGPSDKNMMVLMPRGLGKILNPGSPFLWEYELHTGGNRPPERTFTGRTLGGSSSVNGMIYMRGAPRDYDGWAASGCEGWGWADVGRKFIELEDHDLGADHQRGAGGPLHITTHPKGEPILDIVLQAGEQMGVPRVADVNDVDAAREGGLGYQPSTRFKGERFSGARAFLDPIRNRPNFDIVTDTDTLKVVFEGKRAAGVVLRNKEGTRTVRAGREIILSAGALHSPHLLQHSGIGPADLLKSFGIDVVVDAPGVGKNLGDHRYSSIKFRLKDERHSQNRELSGLRLYLSVLKYLFGRTGPMTHSAHDVGGVAKSEPGLDHADILFGLGRVTTANAGKGGAIALDPQPGLSFLAYFGKPESRGEVRIQSPDPAAAPYVDGNYLSTELDRKKFVAAFRWQRRLADQPALKALIVEETFPGPSVETDADILDRALELGTSNYHFIGTARMGSDPASVVDPQLRVRGVEGLRVADMSIAPTLVAANTNGPAMMIGLRAADFILADRAKA